MMKTRQDNDVTNRTGMIYTENNTDILWPIGSVVNYYKYKIWQLRDW